MPTVSSKSDTDKAKRLRTVSSPDAEIDLADTAPTSNPTKKKGKHGASKKKSIATTFYESDIPDLAQDEPPSPSEPQFILEQTVYPFSEPNDPIEEGPDEESETTRKVSSPYSPSPEAWAQAVPFGRSPPAPSVIETSLKGSSPVHHAPLGRGGFSTKTPPRSPAQRHARPLSYGSAVPPVPIRPPSSEYGHRRSVSNYGSPPLPHLPQQHFYGAPNVDLGMGHVLDTPAVGEKTFVGFRNLPSSSVNRSSTRNQGILVGSDGRIDILAMGAGQKYRPVGALQGLHGTVYDATFLTWESGSDPFAQSRPLIAVTCHGPRIGHGMLDAEHITIRSGVTPSRPGKSHGIAEYDTRVEIFSLATRACVASLLSVQATTASVSWRGTTPPPHGDLRLSATGNTLVVSSGMSGEIWVFAPRPLLPQFECRGKLWTSLQLPEQRRDSSHSRSPEVLAADGAQPKAEPEVAILSTSKRWLAICPPNSPRRPPIPVQIHCQCVSKTFARIDAITPPAEASATCAVDSPDAETLLGKVARGVAQEVVKGAKWLGDQGAQTWNSYWKKDLPNPASSTYHTTLYPQPPPYGVFPPTHAQDSDRVSREPDLVSIISLEDLTAIATFQPPGSCSFLSFTPDGLGLLTASRKGDVQYVWDLMQMKYLRNGVFLSDGKNAEPTTTRVRQVAKFERLTPSSIVEVIWEPFVGERFALLTKRGTVHLFDMPEHAFRWPPRRTKRARPMSAPDHTSASGMNESAPAGGFLASAISIASRTQPILANLRGRAPNFADISATGFGLASATGAAGGRVVAAGLSKSLGAATGTVNSLRHAGENRLRLEFLAKDPTPGRISWTHQSQKAAITLLKMDSFRNYLVKRPAASEHRSGQKSSQFEARKAVSFKLPELQHLHSNAEDQDVDVEVLAGFWSLQVRSHTPSTRISHPLSHAEIETNAPYQPFHSDPRVGLYVYAEEPNTNLDGSQLPTASTMFERRPKRAPPVSSSSQQWVFGEPIPAWKLNIRSSHDEDEDEDENQPDFYRETTATRTIGGDVPEQIVSTTRRKKGKKGDGSSLDQEGFFEDDCDVLDFVSDRV